MTGGRTDVWTPDRIVRWANWGLGLGLAFGMFVTLAAAWLVPEWLFLLPAVLIAGGVLLLLIQRPLLHLCVVLAGFVSILGYGEGLAIEEVLFGLYYLGYLGCWFVYRVYFCKEQIFRTLEDKVLALFLVYATASLALTPVLGGDLGAAVGQWLPLTVFGFYYPIKEACREHPQALKAILITFVFITLFVTLRNVYVYYRGLQSAQEAWHIVLGRERMNERFLMVGMLGGLAFFLHAETWRRRIVLFALTLLPAVGVIIGRSRAIWVACLLGVGILFLLMERKQRVQLTLVMTTLGGLVIGIGVVFLGDVFSLVMEGLADRFLSLGSAATRDVSLVNRFYEWGAAWDAILRNPVLGYGFGVPYQFYNIIYGFTEVKTHVHSTYLGLLYRHGIIGAGLFFSVIVATMWRGVQLYRRGDLSGTARLFIMSTLAAMVALALSATTESLLLNDDGTLILVFLLAPMAGQWQREQAKLNTDTTAVSPDEATS